MRKNRRQDLKFSCPSGGKFYSCDSDSDFVGCCTVNPCTTGCNEGNLRLMSFNVDAFSELRDQQCSTSSRWYTCAYTQPPFLGCCKLNPCHNNGCPVGDLTAGFLDSNPMIAAPFVSAVGSLTSTPSVATSTSTPTSDSAQPLMATSSSKSNKASSGAVAGSVIGSIALAVLLILAAVFLIYRRKRAPMPSDPMSQSTNFYEKDGINIHKTSPLHSDERNNFNHEGLPYPEPILAKSPIDRHGYQNPPVYSAVNRLKSSLLPLQKIYNHSSQTFELPSPDDSHTRHSGSRLGPSMDRLRTATTPITTMQAASVNEQYPSPLSTVAEGPPRGLNARSNTEIRRYQVVHSNMPMGTEHHVEEYRRPGFTARGHISQSPPPWSGY